MFEFSTTFRCEGVFGSIRTDLGLVYEQNPVQRSESVYKNHSKSTNSQIPAASLPWNSAKKSEKTTTLIDPSNKNNFLNWKRFGKLLPDLDPLTFYRVVPTKTELKIWIVFHLIRGKS